MVAQRVRDELRREPCFRCGPCEVLLIAAADDEFVLAALEQVPVAGGAVVGGDVLVDRLVTYEDSGMPRQPLGPLDYIVDGRGIGPFGNGRRRGTLLVATASPQATT
jgi:hypothetical protein